MIDVTLKNVKTLFNTKAILTPAEKMQRSLLSKFGGYCRTVMRNSIKQAPGPDKHARPGDPPYYHKHARAINYRDTIFFVVDWASRSVTIGGVLLSGTAAGGKPVPGMLEHGSATLGVQSDTAKVRTDKGRAKRIPGNVAPHPHSRPAFDKAIKKKLPELIKGGIMKHA